MSALAEVDDVHEPIREAYEAALEDDWGDCESALLEALGAAKKRKGGQSDE